MTKAEMIMSKLAESDNRPEAGWWAKGRAAGRAIRDEGGKLNKVFNSKEYSGTQMQHQTKSGLIGGGIGAGIGALGLGGAAVARLGRDANIPKALGYGALIGGGVGLVAGQMHGSVVGQKNYLHQKGIEQGFWGVKSMSAEAKKKYLSDKYRGGGFKS